MNTRTVIFGVGVTIWICAVALSGCSSSAQKGQPAPPQPAAPTAAPAPAPAETSGPEDVEIGNLVPDPARVVRVKGVVSQVIGMRLVPPKIIFNVTDNSGTVKVVINEKTQLTEGTKIEIVGKYHTVPSPSHSGPGEAPTEEVFVVDRFLDLP